MSLYLTGKKNTRVLLVIIGKKKRKMQKKLYINKEKRKKHKIPLKNYGNMYIMNYECVYLEKD